ncbi:MAG: 2Fe-2S iron-sulfur cluster-binding protein, partial [Candidatus Competibacter phosphatis]
MNEQPHFILDGRRVPFEDGQTLMTAALEAGVYIPHLCFNPEFTPHGSCR